MATTLIINADDLGFSAGITDGILRSHRGGILTSATLMTTMPDRDRAIDLALAEKNLGVGVHLCLTQGVPLTQCTRILDQDGKFIRSLPKLFLKLRKKSAQAEAQAEMIAQIEYAQSRGIHVTHVDSHKHVAHLPALHHALINACLQTNIHWLRTAREIRIPGTPAMSPPYRMLASCANKLAARALAAGLKTTDWFFGLSTTGHTTTDTLQKLAAHAPEGLGELMVHPGYVHDSTRKDTSLLQERVAEMEAICEPLAKSAINAARIKLARFGD